MEKSLLQQFTNSGYRKFPCFTQEYSFLLQKRVEEGNKTKYFINVFVEDTYKNLSFVLHFQVQSKRGNIYKLEIYNLSSVEEAESAAEKFFNMVDAEYYSDYN